MAQFGMLKEHKDVLRENRVFLLDNLNPEPVMQRLYQQNMISNITMESIKAFSTRYEKNVALMDYLPKRGPTAFQLFCRALSASHQNHIRRQIQPEGLKWCVGLRTVITYDGDALSLQKGKRSVPFTLSHWNKLMRHIPEIQENLDQCKNIQLPLEDDLYVMTREITDLMYVGFHTCVGQEMPDTGINLTMEEWTDLLVVMESITEEVNESHLKPPQFHLYDLIHLTYIYILERDIIARAHSNCFGCENDSPGQRDHMSNGCLSEWNDMVHLYFTEAVTSFSRPLFAEVCR